MKIWSQASSDGKACVVPGDKRAGRRGGGVAALVVLFLVVACFAALVLPHLHAVAAGADSSGYLNHARLLGEGRVYEVPSLVPGLPVSKTPPYLYTPLGFKPQDTADILVPTYPFGLPMMLVVLAWCVGWSLAPGLLVGGHALAGLVLMYVFSIEAGLRRPLALAGVLLLAASPLYGLYSVQLMSDVPAMVWVLASLLGALLARRGVRWAYLSGFAFAVAVFIRPSNAMVLPALLVCQGLGPGVSLRFLLAGLPLGAAYLFLNRQEYGSMLSSGYGDASYLFSSDHVRGTLGHYAVWLPRLFTPVVWLFPLLFLARGAGRRVAWALGLWVLACLAFYAAYFHTHETWWYLRFVLPAVPALLVGGLLVLQRVEDVCGGATWSRLLVLLPVLLASRPLLLWGELNVRISGRYELAYQETATWVGAKLPADAFVVCFQYSGALKYYTSLAILRWDQGDPAERARLREALLLSGRPVYAVLLPFEEEARALEGCGLGDWELVRKIGQASVWRLRR